MISPSPILYMFVYLDDDGDPDYSEAVIFSNGQQALDFSANERGILKQWCAYILRVNDPDVRRKIERKGLKEHSPLYGDFLPVNYVAPNWDGEPDELFISIDIDDAISGLYRFQFEAEIIDMMGTF